MRTTFLTLLLTTLAFFTIEAQMSAEQWQEDLEFLQQTVHDDYPHLFKKTTKEEFDTAVNHLHSNIPSLQEHEIIVGLARIVSMFKYGHTDIDFAHGDFSFRHLPFNLYQYNDGIFIQGTHKDHAEALGSRVLEVAGVPIDSALTKIYPVVPAENSQYFKAFGINYLRIPEVLHAQKITPSLQEEVALTLVKDGKTFTHTFKALPKGERPPVKYSHILQQEDWLEARDQSETPLYLAKLDRRYFYEYLPEEKAVYVRQSSVFHDEDEDISAFYNRVFDFIEANEVDKLILDVRLNGGGNNFNNKDVVTGIIRTEKINQMGKFFVILGRRTFSAAQNLVLELDNYTNAIFVGEPTSENVNFYGDNQKVALPNSGIPVYLSWAWWQDKPQWQDGPWLAPHLAVDMSYEEYATNQDPVLDAALNFDGKDFVTDPMQYMTELYQKGEREKLMAEAQRMIADPAYQFFDFEGELNSTGYQVLNRGNAEEALAIFGFVTQLFPDSANAWDSLAEGYLHLGDKETAISLYNKALSMDPDGPVGKNAKQKLQEIKSSKP